MTVITSTNEFIPIFEGTTKKGDRKFTGTCVIDGVYHYITIIDNKNRTHDKQPVFNMTISQKKDEDPETPKQTYTQNHTTPAPAYQGNYGQAASLPQQQPQQNQYPAYGQS